MAATIEILQFRKVNQGNLRAFVDIQIGHTTFRDFRVVHVDGQTPWVSSPQTSWKDGNGEIKYKSIITFPKELKELVDSMILARYQRETGVETSEPF
ncbi:MAG: hypothetical protein GTN76_12970 [Candidatus Aenigmarchaeota archaeon]|nr:hypothetical protein [Candidatus Aenigmarchaeota archaeon]